MDICTGPSLPKNISFPHLELSYSLSRVNAIFCYGFYHDTASQYISKLLPTRETSKWRLKSFQKQYNSFQIIIKNFNEMQYLRHVGTHCLLRAAVLKKSVQGLALGLFWVLGLKLWVLDSTCDILCYSKKLMHIHALQH